VLAFFAGRTWLFVLFRRFGGGVNQPAQEADAGEGAQRAAARRAAAKDLRQAIEAIGVHGPLLRWLRHVPAGLSTNT
jgi:hypothetical protein